MLDSTKYSFSEYAQVDEQFATIFRKIGATYFFDSCTIWIPTFDLLQHLTSEPRVAFEK